MEKTLLAVALILIATKTLGLAARRLHMPEVVGALAAGVLLGPAAFHRAEYDDSIRLLANLGVLFLMFHAGMETNLGEFKKAGRSALAIAAAGVALPFLLGTCSAFLFYHNLWENLFIGAVLTATSVSITVEALEELGKLNTRAGVNILGAAVIDDVLGLMLISVLLSLSGKGGTGGSLPLTLLKLAAFCAAGAAAVLFLPKALNRLLQNVQPGRTLFALAVAAALLAAFGAESLGVSSVTGAYLCGLALSKLPHKEQIARGVRTISSGFLAPVFFASVGIEASWEGFSPRALLITGVMLLTAVAGKVAGCGGAARAFRLSRSESLQIGFGMLSRGEVAIIAENIGVQAGILSKEVFFPTILVVILTTVLSPVLLRLSFSHRIKTALDKESALPPGE